MCLDLVCALPLEVSNKLKFLRDIHWPDLKGVMVSYLFDFNNEDLDIMDFYTTKSLTWE